MQTLELNFPNPKNVELCILEMQAFSLVPFKVERKPLLTEGAIQAQIVLTFEDSDIEKFLNDEMHEVYQRYARQ